MGRPCDWSCRDHPPNPPFARGGKGRNEIGMITQFVQDQLFARPDRYPDRCGDSKVNTPGTAEPLLCDLASRASRVLRVETRLWLYENVQGRVRQRDQEASPGLRGLFQIAP